MKVKLLYKTDKHHSDESRDLIGVFTNTASFKKEVMKLITNEVNSNDKIVNRIQVTKWHNDFLHESKQTQGLPGDFELYYEEIETNTII